MLPAFDNARFCAAACLCLCMEAGVTGADDSNSQTRDARAVISLPAEEAAQMRSGMRAYLEGIEGIVAGLSENSMAKVAASARRAGMGMLDPSAVMSGLKLPPEVIALSMDTHRKFDELAATAESTGTKLAVTQALASLLITCTSCHATYRLTGP